MTRVLQSIPIVRVRLFGTFHIERKGRALHLPTRKVESLLAFLLLSPQKHTRGNLATLFWGDFPDAKAHISLRRALTILRKKIDREVIIADREIVQVNPTFLFWVDVLEFEKQARCFLVDPAPELNCVDLDLYQGDLLSDLYADWLSPLRDHYHALYVEVLIRFIEILRARSEYKTAIEYANKLLVTDPANERAHQHLMFCHITLGDRHKALQQYETCQRALQAELAVEPMRATQALYNWIKQSTADFSSLAARLTNLPIPISSFVGRGRELSAIRQSVAKTRLVTLTGAGGSGKTRLAIHAATDLIGSFKDGVWWVELAPLTDAALVPSAVAKALGVSTQTSQPVIEILAQFLREKQTLLILDNCEHLIDACAQLTEQLLNACPDLKILCTSRETLGLAGESVWYVPTLSLPDVKSVSLAGLLMQYEGIHLFVERAKEVKSDFTLTDENALAVVQICRQLDGIPLAIELAAARVKVMSVMQMTAYLNDRFHLLTAINRTAQARHRTLRAVIDWSYELLTDEERQLFCRLSVFAGGWTLEATEAVCAAEGSEKGTVLNLLTRLVGKSLVIFNEEEQRYSMLETMRQYGQDKLLQKGEKDWTVQQHLDYFLRLALVGDEKIRGYEQYEWLKWFESEQDNLAGAMEIALSSPVKFEKGCELVCATCWYWKTVGDYIAMKHWLALAFSRSVDLDNLPARAKLLFNAGLYSLAGLNWLDIHQAQITLEESMEIWNALGPDYSLQSTKCLLMLGWLQKRFLNNDIGYAYMNRAAALFEEKGDAWWHAWTLNFIAASLEEEARDIQLNLQVLEKEAALWEKTGDQCTSAMVSLDFSFLACERGDFVDAQKYLNEGLQKFKKLGAKSYLLQTFIHLGDTARALRQYDQADFYYNESIPLIQATMYYPWLPRTYQGLGYVMLRRGNLQQAETYFQAALKESQALNIKHGQVHYIAGHAALAVLRARFNLAVRLLGAFFAQPESLHSDLKTDQRILFLVDQREIQDYLELCKTELEGTAFKQAWLEGSLLSLKEVLNEILEERIAAGVEIK